MLLISCSGENPRILIYSDLPEAVILADLFNSEGNGYTAQIINIDRSGMTEELPEADLVISRDIHAPDYMNTFLNLNSLRAEEFVTSIYPEILLSCIYNTELKLIPLAIDLPVVLEKESSSGGDRKFADWDELSLITEDFNTFDEEALTRAGFSPLWSDEFLTAYLSSETSDYETLFRSPSEEFLPAVNQLREWINEYNAGPERIQAFNEKYMYIPDYRLISGNRIAFSVRNLTETMLLPDQVRNTLSFRYFAPGNRLQISSLVSAGIPGNTGNREGALAFLQWMMNKQTWDDYYNRVIMNRDRIFAFSGISSSLMVNEEVLISIYPELKNRIPYPGEFARVPTIVSQWGKVRNEVLLPFYRRALISENSISGLSEEYEKWGLLNPEPWLSE